MFCFSSPVGPSGPRAGAGIVSTILPRLRRPGVRGSGFGHCPHFRRRTSSGHGVSGRVRMCRTPAPPKEGGGAGAQCIRTISQLAGQPARPGQPETPGQPSRAGKARQTRPGQSAGPVSRATQTAGPSRPPCGICGTRFCQAENNTAAVPEEWAETHAGTKSPS